MPGMAQPLEATSLHAVGVHKAHVVAAKCLFVRTSVGRGYGNNLNTAKRRICNFMEMKNRWDSVSASSGIKLIVRLLLLPGGLSGWRWSPETLLPHCTRGTDLPVGPCSEAGMLPPISGYSVSQGSPGVKIRVLFALQVSGLGKRS